jgi:uncharacterized membrane protein
MASLSNAKTLGGVGSILVLLAAVPSVGWALAIVGLVLTLIAVKYVSDIVNDVSIFNNMLISIVLTISGVIVGTAVILGSVLRFMGLNNLNFGPNLANFNPATVPTGDWIGLAASVFAGLVALWALVLVGAVFLRRSYETIKTKLNVGLFGTAGLLYLIGAATTIVGIGFIVLFVAQILLVASFFSINENIPATQKQTVPVNA